MKKAILLILLISFAAFRTNAQLLNPGFEDWTHDDDLDEDFPDGYFTSNDAYVPMVFLGQTITYETGVTKVEGFSGNAISLKNAKVFVNGEAQDTVAAFATMIDEETGDGIPFHQRPTSLKGYYKFTQGAPAGKSKIDTAFIGIMLVKGNTQGQEGDSIGGGYMKIYETQSTFKPFTIDIGYIDQTSIPDTLYIAFISSDSSGENLGGRYTGTELVVDELSLEGVVAGTKIPLFANADIQAYPNPASDQLNIKNIPAEATRLEVRDFSGRIVKQAEVNSGLSRVNTGDLLPGLFHYNLTDDEGNILFSDKFSVVR